jgi:hypothetical protein
VITTEDINTVVVAALNAQTAIPGKAHPGRGPDEPTAYPYVVFMVTPDAAETFSGARYVQKWRVRAAAYIPVGAPDAVSVADTLAALNTALAITAAAVVANLRNPGEKVMSTRPVMSEEKYEPTLRQGKDVLAAGVTAELLCQGDRSIA